MNSTHKSGKFVIFTSSRKVIVTIVECGMTWQFGRRSGRETTVKSIGAENTVKSLERRRVGELVDKEISERRCENGT